MENNLPPKITVRVIEPELNPIKPKKFVRYAKRTALAILLFGAAGFLFVKLDTSLAAELTDNVLRPVFGARAVVFVEGIFFNISDGASKVVYDFKKPQVPRFIKSGYVAGLSTRLNLQPVPVNSAFTPLDGEGTWHDIPVSALPGQEVMAYTFVRPDASRSFAIVSVVKMDMSALSLGSVAGTVEPGGKVGKFGPGKVPKDIVQSGSLVAAFDGGFQYRDGQYGMIVGDTTYLPLKNNLGTLVGYSDGTLKILNYDGQDLGSGVKFVRQNGPMLVEDGQITVTDPESRKIWGRVVGTDMYTWRSGIGLTQSGELLFAAGNNLSPQTLAQALQMAGATNAIQLDINPHWVRFNIFNSTGNGSYTSVPLNMEMTDGSKEYLHGYQKDFFYVYKK